jgi:hypothetical protein
MVVLSQAPLSLRDRAGDDTVASTKAAADAGCCVYHLPNPLDDVAAAFADIPRALVEECAVWIGLVTAEPRYDEVYAAALARNLRLINSPAEHREIFEIESALPHIADLTAKTAIVRSLDELPAAQAAIGLPAFVKGGVLSRKSKGWRACVAETRDELHALVDAVLADAYISRGRAVVRALLPLRTLRVADYDFPIGREFRAFTYRGEPIALGYYWPWFTEHATLASEEEEAVRALARRAAARLSAPFVSLDIGQLDDGSWTLIETGDPQFSAVTFLPLGAMWRALRALADSQVVPTQ